ncbi:Uu.00g017260.m01.CDS01 [Anthostomella pinea]|uniref:Uu.00g017260.m01.CDS01 n=1 Tax=Anthostomella pinea TaxID=933095 RepID=A0AAI8YNC9_9PEZI|nr:Uu.00g017260.m01.CDS01 [Anthostomella pinea]
MAGKKGGDGSKKAAGQARKAEAAAGKAAAENAKNTVAEDAEWQKGSKSNAKKEAEAAKKAEQARKKAEKDALAAEEEKSLPTRAGPKNAKTAVKKTNPKPSRGLDLGQLESSDPSDKKLQPVVAKTIEDSIKALEMDDKSAAPKLDRHAEKRVRPAWFAFKERRLQEMADDGTGKGLRLTQRVQQIEKEFDKSPENPKNQAHASHNTSREEMEELQNRIMAETEARLTSK